MVVKSNTNQLPVHKKQEVLSFNPIKKVIERGVDTAVGLSRGMTGILRNKDAKRRVSQINTLITKLEKMVIFARKRGEDLKDNTELEDSLITEINKLRPSLLEKRYIKTKLDGFFEEVSLNDYDLENYISKKIKESFEKDINLLGDTGAQETLIKDILSRGNFEKEFVKRNLLEILNHSADYASIAIDSLDIILEELEKYKTNSRDFEYLKKIKFYDDIERMIEAGEEIKQEIFTYISGGAVKKILTWMGEIKGSSWSQEGEGSVTHFTDKAHFIRDQAESLLGLRDGREALEKFISTENGILKRRLEEVELMLGGVERLQEKHHELGADLVKFKQAGKDLYEWIQKTPANEIDGQDIMDAANEVDAIMEVLDEVEATLEEDEKKEEDGFFDLINNSKKVVDGSKYLVKMRESLENKIQLSIGIITGMLKDLHPEEPESLKDRKYVEGLKDLLRTLKEIEINEYTLRITYFEDESSKDIYISNLSFDKRIKRLSKKLKVLENKFNSLVTNDTSEVLARQIGFIVQSLSVQVFSYFLASKFEKRTEKLFIDYKNLNKMVRASGGRSLVGILSTLKRQGIQLSRVKELFSVAEDSELEERELVLVEKTDRLRIIKNLKG